MLNRTLDAMQPVIRAIAEKLQAWLEARFGIGVPVLDRANTGADAAIVLSGYGAGDLYSGNATADDVALLRFRRPDNGEPLAIKFSFAEHQESGQCDCWEVEIDGALDGERDELIALFDPRQRTGSFNNDITPTLRFNGTTVPLQRP
jgi:hypothetical protein